MKDSWALDSDGKLEQGKFFKEKGTDYFKAGKFQLALKMYKKMIDYLEYDSGKYTAFPTGVYNKTYELYVCVLEGFFLYCEVHVTCVSFHGSVSQYLSVSLLDYILQWTT